MWTVKNTTEQKHREYTQSGRVGSGRRNVWVHHRDTFWLDNQYHTDVSLIHSCTFYTKQNMMSWKLVYQHANELRNWLIGWLWSCYRHALKGSSLHPPCQTCQIGITSWMMVTALSLTRHLNQCLWIGLVWLGGARRRSFSVTLFNFFTDKVLILSQSSDIRTGLSSSRY